MPKKRRTVEVLEKALISPHLLRVVLTGEELAEFPTGFEGGYIKLVLPGDGQRRELRRSYTVRAFDEQARRLTLEMVSLPGKGPAAAWAREVLVGDTVTITDPGACQPINLDADWFLLAGDMSALPAIRVNLQRLPADASGFAVIEVIKEADQLDLRVPPGIDLRWIVNPRPDSANSLLEDTVMNLPWRPGDASVWVAGEFSASRALRDYFRRERQIPRDRSYISCYWKIGASDEGMKAAKRADDEPW